MEDNKKSFKEESWGTKIIVIISITILIAAAIGFAFGVYYFGLLGIFKLLGIQYDSLFSFFLFTVLYFLFGIFSDIAGKVFEMLLSHLSLKNFAVMFLINSLLNWAILSLADFIMDSITITPPTLLAAAIVIGLIETVFEKEPKTNK